MNYCRNQMISLEIANLFILYPYLVGNVKHKNASIKALSSFWGYMGNDGIGPWTILTPHPPPPELDGALFFPYFKGQPFFEYGFSQTNNVQLEAGSQNVMHTSHFTFCSLPHGMGKWYKCILRFMSVCLDT